MWNYEDPKWTEKVRLLLSGISEEESLVSWCARGSHWSKQLTKLSWKMANTLNTKIGKGGINLVCDGKDCTQSSTHEAYALPLRHIAGSGKMNSKYREEDEQ